MRRRGWLLVVLCVAAFCFGHWQGTKSTRHACVSDGRHCDTGNDAAAVDTSATHPTRVSEETYDNGNPKRVVVDHPDGKRQSLVYYYPDGSMKAMETRADRLRNGICVTFSEDGTVRTCGVFTNSDLAVGTFRQYYGQYTAAPDKASEGKLYIQHEGIGCTKGLRIVLRPNGLTNSVTPYRNGKPHGPSREYDKGGQLDCIREYENGEEVRRTGYHGDGERRYLSDVKDGFRIWIDYGPNEQIRVHKRTDIKSGKGTVETFTDEGVLSSLTDRQGQFPLLKRDYYLSGKIKTLRNYEDGTEKHFDTDGMLTAVGQYEYNVLVSRKTLDARGETVKTETFRKPEPPPEEWKSVALPGLPGNRIDAPEVFYTYKSYPGIRCINDMYLAWTRTMRNWYKTARFAGGTYATRYPESHSVAGGEIRHHFTVTTTNVAAIGIGFHALGEGPGWVCLTVRADANGKPSDTILARSWLRYPVYCQVPSGGLMVFNLPPLKWHIGNKYWFDCSVDLTLSSPGAHHINYRLIGDDGRVPAFRIIEHCGPVPMQRRVTVSGVRQQERGNLITYPAPSATRDRKDADKSSPIYPAAFAWRKERHP